jgi:hypothetical protein
VQILGNQFSFGSYRRAAEDQRVRRAVIDAGGYAGRKSVPQEAEVVTVDQSNLKALHEIIDRNAEI